MFAYVYIDFADESDTLIFKNMIHDSFTNTWDVPELIRKVRASGKRILAACCLGIVVSVIIISGTPKEYTASTLVAPESYRRGSSSGLSALAGMADIDLSSSSASERDAIFPSLYPSVVKSTPFLIRLFDIEVRRRQDSTPMPLSQYLKEHQERPWWSAVTSAPSRLLGIALSLFKEKPEEDGVKKKQGIDPFRLTRAEAGMAGAIASRIKIEVDKKKRTLTIFVTMQDPLVAAAVTDTVQAHLKEYITDYRTAKARRNLEYAEKLRQEAQAQYYEAQEKYTRYADANRGLVRLVSRAELVRLRNEMNLASDVYNRTEQQVQAATMKVEKVRPVYAVIQPVQVPLAPSKPGKMMILVVCVFLSGAGSIGWVLFGKDFLRNLKKRWKTTDGEKSTPQVEPKTTKTNVTQQIRMKADD